MKFCTGFHDATASFHAGKQGYRRTGRNEQFFYDGLVILALLCITILFEIARAGVGSNFDTTPSHCAPVCVCSMA